MMVLMLFPPLSLRSLSLPDRRQVQVLLSKRMCSTDLLKRVKLYRKPQMMGPSAKDFFHSVGQR